jgi:hypothetical protein
MPFGSRQPAGGDRERRGGAIRTGCVFSIAIDAQFSAASER